MFGRMSATATRSGARLLEACEQRGCPVCRCLGEDSARYLTMVLHELVTDHDVRTKLRASRGFCNWHSGMLRGLPGAAFGTSVLSADLLGRERRRAEAAIARAGRDGRAQLGGIRGWLDARRAGRTRAPARARGCPACESVRADERRYVETMVQLAEEPSRADPLARGGGLCVPHLDQALAQEVSGARRAALARLAAATCESWRRLEAALERFAAKHDHQKRAPFTEEEAAAWTLALEALAGAPGVFGNRLHPAAPAEPRAPARLAAGSRRPR
jgi:hypothetical protein